MWFVFQVIKSKIQSSRGKENSRILDVTKKHFKAEGFRGFFKGWSAAIIRSFPSHAIVLATYQVTMTWLYD